MPVYDINGNIVTVDPTDSTDICVLNNKATTVEKLQQMNRPSAVGTTLQTPPLVLLHFTDIHGDGDCLARLIEYKNTYSDYIADIIHTGDIVKAISTDGIDFWTNTDGSEKILNCIGNHDTRTASSTWVGKSEQSCYETYFAPFITNWGVNYTANVCYYYKDYPANNVRMIMLDAMHQTDAQLTWFTNVLSGARSSGYAVIVCSHVRPTHEFDSLPNSKWDDKWKYGTQTASNPGYPVSLASGYITAVASHISSGGDFVCWLSGHFHKKMAGTLTAYPTQLLFAGSNAGSKYIVNTVYSRLEGTKSQDDFNIIAIDTYKKIMKVMKVGANYDMVMRQTNTFVWDYANGNVLFED